VPCTTPRHRARKLVHGIAAAMFAVMSVLALLNVGDLL
jgi:hypothetical protein